MEDTALQREERTLLLPISIVIISNLMQNVNTKNSSLIKQNGWGTRKKDLAGGIPDTKVSYDTMPDTRPINSISDLFSFVKRYVIAHRFYDKKGAAYLVWGEK